MNKNHLAMLIVGFFILFIVGCGNSSSNGSSDRSSNDPQEPAYDAIQLSATVDNPYFTLTPGTRWLYEGETEEGTETNEVFVSHLTRNVDGVDCRIVVDRVFLEGDLIEETFDWYAQDPAGNVWYMGEDSAEYENGIIVSTAGSWETAVDGAEAGIIMKADLVVGDSYQQEYYAGEAEDMAEIVALDVPVTLSDGTAYTTVKIAEWTPLEPDVLEYKYYTEGVGVVLEEDEDGEERSELKSISLDTTPSIDPADFVVGVDNPYFPLTPGTTYHFEGETEDGTETNDVVVTSDTRQILGVTCIVVEDRVYLEGELIEETFDWYAQDKEGNVWYMGEDSAEYENGVKVSTEGSWEAGVDGAQPGIIMKANPRVGDSYRQEYYAGEAEDMAAVVAVDQSVSVASGDYNGCIKTLEWTPLTADSEEYKYLCPDVGLALETLGDGSEPIGLVEIEIN